MDYILLDNLTLDKKSTLHLKIEEKEGAGKYLYIKGEGIKKGEYALVFEGSENSEYVFHIINVEKDSFVFKFEIDMKKIKDKERLNIVEIYTSDIYFSLKDLHMALNIKKLPFEEDILKEEESIPLENIPLISKDKQEILNEGEENINVYRDSFEGTERELSEEVIKSKEGSVKIINSNEDILNDTLEKIKLDFKEPFSGHIFYKINESLKCLYEINIIYNGFIMPLIYPYMGYYNKDIESKTLPKWIFGKAKNDLYQEYFVYGILGKKDKRFQPFLGTTGYTYYRQIKESELGYWFLYVEKKSGKISLPLKPKDY